MLLRFHVKRVAGSFSNGTMACFATSDSHTGHSRTIRIMGFLPMGESALILTVMRHSLETTIANGTLISNIFKEGREQALRIYEAGVWWRDSALSSTWETRWARSIISSSFSPFSSCILRFTCFPFNCFSAFHVDLDWQRRP